MVHTLGRATRPEVAIMLYYHIKDVNDKAVSEILELKTGFDEFTPKDCRQRIDFIREEDFPRKDRHWDCEGIGQKISELVDRDAFLHLTNIDAACESILAKVGPFHPWGIVRSCVLTVTVQHGVEELDTLKSNDNPVKKKAMPALHEKARNHEREVRKNEARRLEHEQIRWGH